MKKASFLKSLIFPILTVSVLVTMAYGSSSEKSQDDFAKATEQLSNNLGMVVNRLNKNTIESVSEVSPDQLKKEYGELFLKALRFEKINKGKER